MEKSQATAGNLPDPVPTASGYIKPQYRPPHDPTVTFEEYHHYALKTRDKELALEAPKLNWREWFSRRKHAAETDTPIGGVVTSDPSAQHTSPVEKGHSDAEQSHRVDITDEEWENASRALRTASAGACKP
jgi:hypothetical protein